MITFAYDCPHCRTKRVAFTVTGFYYPRTFVSGAYYVECSLMANCNKCRKAIVADLELTREAAQKLEESFIKGTDNYNLSNTFPLNCLDFHPKLQGANIPRYLPEDVESELKTAENLYLLNNDENNFTKPAGNSYRSVLEKALCHLAENNERARLNKRIEKLFDEGKLTVDLKNFAMHIRALSVEASHSYNDFTLEELNDLRLFINLFLQYAFTLPAMIPQSDKIEIDNQQEQQTSS